MGGATSIDITKPGIDKAYGIKKLKKILKIKVLEMIFISNALLDGGNDYPAYKTGVHCIKVRGPENTKRVTEGIWLVWVLSQYICIDSFAKVFDDAGYTKVLLLENE